MSNPLLNRGALPDFDAVKPGHYLPAIDHELAAIQQKLEAIKNNPAPADFVNTILPLESLFGGISGIMCLLSNQALNTYTKELGAIDEEASIKIDAVRKNVFQDAELGKRFQEVYKNRAAYAGDEDDKALLKDLYLSFESSGALLPPEGQKKIREIDEKLISLSQAFKDNMQAAPGQNAVLITDVAELAGLSVEEIEGFAENAKEKGHAGGWLVTPERLLVDELLERAENSNFRKKIFKALDNFGKQPPHDNAPVLQELQELRDDYAKLLGYDHYAAFARSRAMVTDLAEVNALLTDIAAKALPKFEADMRALETFSAQSGGPGKLEPWDVSYWATKQRDALYHFDANAFAEYLELENTLKGMFNEASHLFGISFTESKKYSVMHPDIRTFEVTDAKSGDLIGVLHVDMFARPGTKNGGAWMSQLQPKSDAQVNAIILNMNIAKPVGDKPALVGLSQYITLYHEMGHCLQGLLGTNVKYLSQQGTAAPADFVEFHSMVNERRAVLKKNLQQFAINVKTGKPAPDALIDALIASNAHFASRDTLKIVQNSLRDLAFHTVEPKDYPGIEKLEESVRLQSPYAEHIRPYSLSRFDHLFSDAHSGYAAGYVNYLIAEVHAADGFVPFVADPYDPQQAEKLSKIYHRGSGGDPATLYRDYRGKDATPDAMLIANGIIEAKKNTPPPKAPAP